MKKLFFLLLLPFAIFAQQTTLIGDVDCNGEINSEDASLILQFVTSVIDTLPCQANMSGITPDQLEEIITMMSGQLSINYSGLSFDNWILKYENPSFDNLIYGQEESDGFLLVQYSRASQSNSSSSFGFNIYVGNELDTVDFVMDVEINIKNSWNPIDSKTIPVKKGDYWLLEDDSGTSIDKVYFLPINANNNVDNTNSNSGQITNKSMLFPDGIGGEPLSWSLETSDYLVPNGKNLYITQYHNTEQSNGLLVQNITEDLQLVKGHSNYVYYTGVGFSPSNTNNMPIVIGPGETITGTGSFNAFLIDAIVTPLTLSVIDSYVVPDDKMLYILQFFGEDQSLLVVDDVPLIENYSNHIFYTGVGFTPAINLSIPIIVGPGQIINGSGNINGYLTELNYF